MRSLSFEGRSWDRAELRPALHRGGASIRFFTRIGGDRSRQTFGEGRQDLLPFQQVGIAPVGTTTLQKAVVFDGKKRLEEILSELKNG
jgi:hypothetical protein